MPEDGSRLLLVVTECNTIVSESFRLKPMVLNQYKGLTRSTSLICQSDEAISSLDDFCRFSFWRFQILEVQHPGTSNQVNNVNIAHTEFCRQILKAYWRGFSTCATNTRGDHLFSIGLQCSTLLLFLARRDKPTLKLFSKFKMFINFIIARKPLKWQKLNGRLLVEKQIR